MNTWKGLGISFAHDYHEYDDNQLCQQRLQELWDAGIRKIRINMPPYTTETQNVSLRNKLRLVVTTALDKGFYVVWGYTKSQQTEVPAISAATWPTYRDAVLAMAAWAQGLANGTRFELSLGNEDDDKVDGTTLTSAQFRANILALATTCKGLFTQGKISYTSTIAFYNDWRTLGKGDLDYYGVNIYGGPSIFDTYAKALKRDWGELGYIAEWNAADEGVNAFADEDSFNRELMRRYHLLRSHTITAYFFVYRSWGVAEKWALIKNNNVRRAAWYLLTSARPPVYSLQPRKNPARNYCTNPSFEASTANWTVENGATLTRLTAGGAPVGTAYAQLMTTSNSAGRMLMQPLSGLRFAGKRCVMSWYARAGTSATMYVEALVGGSPAHIYNTLLSSEWRRYTTSFLVTGTGSGGIIYVYPKQQGTTTTGSIYLDAVQIEFIEASLPQSAYPSEYLDGSLSGEGCRWDGTPNLSSSSRYTTPARLPAVRTAGVSRAVMLSRSML